MAYRNDSNKNCFTFIWKLENASYCWQKAKDSIKSPLFTVDEMYETNWKLELFLSGERSGIGFYLQRQCTKNPVKVEVDCELALLSPNGSVLKSMKERVFSNARYYGYPYFVSRNEAFFERKSVFLPQDTLTARCRIWKTDGEMSKNVQCIGRTRIVVEKTSFLWKIENFSSMESSKKITHDIKSTRNVGKLMTLELILTGGLIFERTIRFIITPNFRNIMLSTFRLSIVDASKNTMKYFQDEFWYGDVCDSKYFTLFNAKTESMEKESAYLPNDVLSLWCECAFCFGTTVEEFEKVDSDCIVVEKKASSLTEKGALPGPINILIQDFKSMLNNDKFSDIKLKTRSRTYHVNKSILSCRSPVFKAMFSNDIEPKLNDCVHIDDLNDDTVFRMLRYIYCGEVEELNWKSATELFEAAEYYQITNLKNICSSYLKSILDLNNATKALVLSHMHQDGDFKSFVQNFILRHGKDIINSEEWGKLMETNMNLAAETMRLKFKE